MRTIRGPFSFSIHGEVGTLIDGFEYPTVAAMGHSRPCQAKLIEAAGFTKIKDVHAWKHERNELPPHAHRALQAIASMPEVQLRSLNRSKIREEIELIMSIMHEATEDLWGFTPWTPAETEQYASVLAPVLDPHLICIAEIDGEPIGVCLAIPNFNEAMHDFHGQLGIREHLKFWWRLIITKPKSYRLMLFGIRKKLRRNKRYAGLGIAMCASVAKHSRKRGYQWAELGWTHEDNRPVRIVIQALGGKKYKNVSSV